MSEREPWPKPLTPPSIGKDPVAHLAQRQPSDPSLMRLVTVRVQGSDQHGQELLIPLHDIHDVLRRAARYRALQWPDIGPPERVINDMVLDVNPSPLLMEMPGGWIEVGKVLDPWGGPSWLAVRWRELTNEVKVERPEGWRRLGF